jgi:hypothetical protein
MKRLGACKMAALFLGLALVPAAAAAQSSESPFGLGLIVGDPFGLTAKLWLGPHDALQANLGWRTAIYGTAYYYDVWQPNAPYFSLDWVHHSHWARSYGDRVHFGGYIGIGGGVTWLPGSDTPYYDVFGNQVVTKSAIEPALRVPIGLDLEYQYAHIETFVEAVPMIALIVNDSSVWVEDIMVDLGFRFYF